MIGQMSICQICMFQSRREDNGQETRCVAFGLEIDYDACDGFELLEGRQLGARLAELYSQVELVWGRIEAILDKVEVAAARPAATPDQGGAGGEKS